MSVVIDTGKLGVRIKSDAKGLPKVLINAMFSAGQRGKAFLVKESPVDRGALRVAWRVIKLSDGVEVINDQPYAGVMELGARPFKIGSAGIWALKAWVMRKLQSGAMNGRSSIRTGKLMKRRKTPSLEAEAESIAWAIAKTFEKYGIKGKRFVYKNLPKLAELMDDEINRYLAKFFNRSMK